MYNTGIGMVGKIRKLRVYMETTTFNYYFDDRDGHEDTVKLFEAIGAGKYEGYMSIHVTDELENAHEPKRSNMLSLIENYGMKPLMHTAQVDILAKLYIERSIIPREYRLDSLHIAIASVHNLDCVVSYNFKHINRKETKANVALVNSVAGYNGVDICTSKEVLEYGG